MYSYYPTYATSYMPYNNQSMYISGVPYAKNLQSYSYNQLGQPYYFQPATSSIISQPLSAPYVYNTPRIYTSRSISDLDIRRELEKRNRERSRERSRDRNDSIIRGSQTDRYIRRDQRSNSRDRTPERHSGGNRSLNYGQRQRDIMRQSAENVNMLNRVVNVKSDVSRSRHQQDWENQQRYMNLASNYPTNHQQMRTRDSNNNNNNNQIVRRSQDPNNQRGYLPNISNRNSYRQ